MQQETFMFSRYLAVTALSIAAIAGVRSYRNAAEPPRRSWAMLEAELPSTMDPANLERYRELQDLARRREAYATFAEQLTLELANGTIKLREATDALFYFCIQNYPEQLEHARFAEDDLTLNIKIKIARNLVRSTWPPSVSGPGDAQIEEAAARLERELCELPYETECSTPLERQ
jgi:hypothetical protein